MYQALHNNLTVKESKIHGLGLFAANKIPPGTNLGISHFREESGEFENNYIRTPLGGFINHADTPNCKKTGHNGSRVISIVTLSDIEEGDELTVYYTLYNVSI
tara:strand:- start:66 stop:374 length:309 start_codon:yes stop_codon:yes gene_type:complete